MGYWKQSEEGASLQCKGELTWGDAPADIMGNALREICDVFLFDRDRLPTEEEVKAGLLFSLSTSLKRAEERHKAPQEPATV